LTRPEESSKKQPWFCTGAPAARDALYAQAHRKQPFSIHDQEANERRKKGGVSSRNYTWMPPDEAGLSGKSMIQARDNSIHNIQEV
jgi:hypothetical protein